MVKSRFDFIKLHLQGPKILDVGNIGNDEYGVMYKNIIEFFKDFTIIGLDNDIEKAKRFNLPNQVIGDA